MHRLLLVVEPRVEPKRIRIHGDNIVECERALVLLTNGDESLRLLPGRIFCPTFSVVLRGVLFHVQLFPGFKRWQQDIGAHLQRFGSPLAEAADAVITELVGPDLERILIAIEFCGALPAGNNAWQRSGRSYGHAEAGVPYLYISELGGAELLADRKRKGERLPNALVPFSYIAQNEQTAAFAIPIYLASPSSTPESTSEFGGALGADIAHRLVLAAVLHEEASDDVSEAVRRARLALDTIARRSADRGGLDAEDWTSLLTLTPLQRAEFFAVQGPLWHKIVSIPVSPTFSRLRDALASVGARGVGSRTMPVGVIPAEKRAKFADLVGGIYRADVSEGFLQWLSKDAEALLVVLVAGFKPKGEDSRPDRGLTPMARMAFGRGVQLLTIVYGPGSTGTWEKLKTEPSALAKANGLWQALLGLSDGLICDTTTTPRPILELPTQQAFAPATGDPALVEAASHLPRFGEQDVDSVIKIAISVAPDSVFEGLCNPPGGDWSGISYLARPQGVEFRWTSLPRVTSVNSKRPDHVLQFFTDDGDVILSVESKGRLSDFESDIGSKLKNYVSDLFQTVPNVKRQAQTSTWLDSSREVWSQPEARVVAGGAFRLVSEDIVDAARRLGLDIAMGVVFEEAGRVLLHLAYKAELEAVARIWLRIADSLDEWLVVEEYCFGDVVE